MNFAEGQKSKAEDVLTHLDMSLDEMIASHHATQRVKTSNRQDNIRRAGSGHFGPPTGNNATTYFRKGAFGSRNGYLKQSVQLEEGERRGTRPGQQTTNDEPEFSDLTRRPRRRDAFAFQPYYRSEAFFPTRQQRRNRSYTDYGSTRSSMGGNARIRVSNDAAGPGVDEDSSTYELPRDWMSRAMVGAQDEDIRSPKRMRLLSSPPRGGANSRSSTVLPPSFTGSSSLLQGIRRRNHPLKAALFENRLVAISGLDYTVMTTDLEELFLSVGPVEKCWIDYDRTDRSLGTGGVIFYNKRDAFRAVDLYNGRFIDSQPLQLELVAQSY